MDKHASVAQSTGEAMLRQLAARGVDFFFANSGTDFPSLVEAFARARDEGFPVPRPVLVTHENVGVCMAYGATLATGRAQAVMVHVNVGSANALCGVINAARENVPMLMMAGRTPWTETGAAGTRSMNIHWAQEMFDQGGMLREQVKWDYELRDAGQLASLLDRALAISASEPAGPVYLSLPREVLAQTPSPQPAGPAASIAPLAPAMPDPGAVRELAAMLAGAKRPLVITARAGRDPAAVPLLARLAERYALPVVEYRARYLCLPADHPMHGGYEVDAWLEEADAVLVLDCDVPWIPSVRAPRDGVPIVQAGIDPLFSRYPVRGFGSSLNIACAPANLVAALERELDALGVAPAAIAERRAHVQARGDQRRAQVEAAVERGAKASPMGMAWVTRCLARALPADAAVVNEYSLQRGAMGSTVPGSFFRSSPVGGLGWGVPAALGIALAQPGRTVVAAVGDGAYGFANPLACHHTAAMHGIAFLTLVMNNETYGAVERATHDMYPAGAAARGGMTLSSLAPVPAFEQVVAACGGWGERVDDAAALPGALERALRVVREEKRQALLNVRCA